jgi:hypothetical protein
VSRWQPCLKTQLRPFEDRQGHRDTGTTRYAICSVITRLLNTVRHMALSTRNSNRMSPFSLLSSNTTFYPVIAETASSLYSTMSFASFGPTVSPFLLLIDTSNAPEIKPRKLYAWRSSAALLFELYISHGLLRDGSGVSARCSLLAFFLVKLSPSIVFFIHRYGYFHLYDP